MFLYCIFIGIFSKADLREGDHGELNLPCVKWMILASQLILSSNFSEYSGLFELFIVMIIFNVYILVLFIETS